MRPRRCCMPAGPLGSSGGGALGGRGPGPRARLDPPPSSRRGRPWPPARSRPAGARSTRPAGGGRWAAEPGRWCWDMTTSSCVIHARWRQAAVHSACRRRTSTRVRRSMAARTVALRRTSQSSLPKASALHQSGCKNEVCGLEACRAALASGHQRARCLASTGVLRPAPPCRPHAAAAQGRRSHATGDDQAPELRQLLIGGQLSSERKVDAPLLPLPPLPVAAGIARLLPQQVQKHLFKSALAIAARREDRAGAGLDGGVASSRGTAAVAAQALLTSTGIQPTYHTL